MQWWCSAQTAAWTWEWQPYPGVWLFVLLLGGGYLWLRRRYHHRDRGDLSAGEDAGRRGWFALGLVLVWLALDWPVGPLGAGYLASVHMGQVLVLSLLAPAFLIMGIPRAAFRPLTGDSLAARIVGRVTHPVAALLVFNGILVATHVPVVLDGLSSTQAGMLAMDLAWILGGLTFWWPVLAPAPRRPWFNELFEIGYVFLNTIPTTVPYGFLVFAEFPLYATYELAPPVAGIASVTDQQIAGFIMKLGGGIVLWTAMTILFFRWYVAEEREGSAAGAS